MTTPATADFKDIIQEPKIVYHQVGVLIQEPNIVYRGFLFKNPNRDDTCNSGLQMLVIYEFGFLNKPETDDT